MTCASRHAAAGWGAFVALAQTLACGASSSATRASGGSDAASPAPVGVYTQHNDNGRTGLNAGENILTPTNLDTAHFGKKFALPVDGYVYTQPLYVSNVSVPAAGMRNLVFVGTEHDSVYAFDADTPQAAIWHRSFLGAGVTPVPPADTAETGDLIPEIGISGTPAIDAASGTLYVVANTKEPGPTYVFRLHALDIATGAEKLGGPVVIKASVSGNGADNVGGVITLSSLYELQRPGLALSGGLLYVAFGDHGDHFNWHGWVLAYDATTLAQKAVFCTTPDANEASIWQSGACIAVDSAGNAYVETGNGDFDGKSGGRDYGMSVVKVSPAGAVVDWFAPHDAVALSQADIDFGSSGPMLVPDAPGAAKHLLVATGKPGYGYVLDQDQLGHFDPAGQDTQIVEKLTVKPNTAGITSGIFTSPVFYGGRLYTAAVDDKIKAFNLTGGTFSATPVSQSTATYSYPGATLSVSANGASAGIVWAVQGDGYTPAAPAVLRAYDASDLSKELYSSDQAAAMRDVAGPAVKFAVPTIASGHVYLGTETEIDVYGVLP